MKFLLNKKTVLVGGIIGALILVGMAFSKRGEVKVSLEEKNNFSQPKNIDSDKDGLFDWQEVFYGTDPKNPDSDGDGTLDGEEVKLKRNPLKAGKDNLEIFKLKDSNSKISEEEKINFTQYLASIIFFEKMADLRSENPVSSQEDVDLVLRILEKKMPELLNQFEVERNFPSLEELKICKENSLEAQGKYFKEMVNLFGSVFERYDSRFLLKEFFQENNPRPIKNFLFQLKEKKQKANKKCIPKECLEIHREFMGILNVIENIFGAILEYKKDPLKALVAMERLKRLREEIEGFVEVLKNKFYKKNESGS